MASSSSSSHPARNEFFQRLKPLCVPISQFALKGTNSPQDARTLVDLIQQVHHVVQEQLSQDPTVLDEKLADYIFFPLSHVLRNEAEHPARLTEACLRCTTLLITHGWKARISPQIVEQLLILATFVAGGVPGREITHDTSEETVLEALRCLSALISVAGTSGTASAALVDAPNVPALAHTVTVLIQSFTDGRTTEIKLQALKAMQAIFMSIKDRAALATVFPGVASNLARLLSSPAKEKTRVLVASVQTLRIVLISVLSDLHNRAVLLQPSEPPSETVTADQKVLSLAWLKATAGQVKMALGNVLKLRTHSSDDVRNEVGGLALTLLDECHATLENCTPALVETCIVLEPEEESKSRLTTSLSDLASIYPELAETIKVAVYNWTTSLPRLMQSAEEEKKQAAIYNVVRGMQLVMSLHMGSSTLEAAVSLALRDSVSSLILEGSSQHSVQAVSTRPEDLSHGALLKADEAMLRYPPVILEKQVQAETRAQILNLLSKVGSTSRQVALCLEMLDNARGLDGEPQVASYWLSFELVKAASGSSAGDADDFLDFSAVTPKYEDPEAALSELYTHSVAVVDAHGEDPEADWRMEAIALEVIAFAASRAKESFRPELIDVLYPIATILGSAIPRLRECAMMTLNMLASSCAYGSVSELIVDNADYMINSISLRLDTLDISPASAKVLVMIIRLTGPQLVPYLDDVVASIFAALENYHGYPFFVESLFSILKEVVDQGVTSNRLLLEGRETRVPSRKTRPAVARVEDTLQLLDRRAGRRRDREAEDAEIQAITGHPEQPWRPEKQKQKLTAPDDPEGDTDQQMTEPEKEKPPKTPTYTLLERVASLTQYYLTSPTPTLRKSLLDLLATASPALAADEDAFLPLVNAIWPVVIARLSDSEPFVVLAACEALAVLCASAGDFLASRIKAEWSDGLGQWCRKKKAEAARKASASRQGDVQLIKGLSSVSNTVLVPGRDGTVSNPRAVAPSSTAAPGTITGGLGRFASAAQIWEAAVNMLVAVVSYVRVEDPIFDDILGLLMDRLPRDTKAHDALAQVNPDAVWYAMYLQGTVEVMNAPEIDGLSFSPMVSAR